MGAHQLQPRPSLALSAVEADLSGAAIDQFAVALGGRQAVLDTLAIGSAAPEIDRITRLLEDPRYAGWSLRKICGLAGITVADLFGAFRKATLIKAHLEATTKVAASLVAVVEDVMQRSRPQQLTCPTCLGTTSYTPEPTKKDPQPEPRVCPTCRRSAIPGTIVELPDLDRQKVALELGQLLQSRSGISIQQNTLAVGASGGSPAPTGTAPGSLEALQQAVHTLLYPRAAVADAAPVVEGQVIPPAEDP